MIHRLAKTIAQKWVITEIAAADEAEAYQYGIELILSTSINTILIIVVSALYDHPFAFIPYLIVFIPLRLCAGGYHAKNHLACIIFNLAVYFAALALSNNLSGKDAQMFCLCESVISFLAVLLLAPVQSKNKPLTENEKRRNREKAIFISSLILILSFLLAALDLYNIFSCKMLFCGQASSTILLLLSKAG